MYVVACGNAFDGIELFGPFQSSEQANEYADEICHKDTWVVIALTKPGNGSVDPNDGVIK